MKVLHVSCSDNTGGAARSAYRLHKSLQMLDVHSEMLVQSKTSDDPSVVGPVELPERAISKCRPFLDSLPVKRYTKRCNILFSPAWLPFSGMVSKINDSHADIVHLHWITGGMLRISELAKLTKPLVWSLLDMWAFTGGCHYDNNCRRYIHQCGFCPVLKSHKNNDLSRKVHNLKAKTFSALRFKIVGHSKWLTNCAAKSSLFSKISVRNLPSPVDTYTYKPVNKGNAREILHFSINKNNVLFGAVSATEDPRKGFKELLSSMNYLKSKNVELAIFGSEKPQRHLDLSFPTHYLGKLFDDISLRVVYSAADVTVVPSLQENLSNVIMESLACGTPVVAFNIGGNPDMIEHQINGYLAEPYDPTDLARGIDWVLNHPDPEALSRNAREKVVREFDSRVVAKRYVELYEEVLKTASPSWKNRGR